MNVTERWLEANNLEPLQYPNTGQYLAGLVHDTCHALLNLGAGYSEEVYVVCFQLGCEGYEWEAIDPNDRSAPLAYAYWLEGVKAPQWVKEMSLANSVTQLL